MEKVKLVGSEKQVAWAEDIRKTIEKYADAIKQLSNELQDKRQVEELGRLIEHLIYNESSAKLYIDNFSAITRKDEWSTEYKILKGISGVKGLPRELQGGRAAKNIRTKLYEEELKRQYEKNMERLKNS